MPIIYGAASDVGDGKVFNVEIAVSTNSQSSFWNGSAWITGSAIWLPVTADNPPFDSNAEPWTYTGALPVLENSKTYEIQVQITDKAGRIRLAPAAPLSFTIDTASPTARTLIPASAVTPVNYMPSISGTAYDNGRNEAVYVAIQKQVGAGWWYSGSAFNEPNLTWLKVGAGNGFLSPDATSWTYAPATLAADLDTGYRYLLLVKSTDVAGNIQEVFTVGVSSMYFTMDKGPPVSAITRPVSDVVEGSGRYRPADIGQFSGNNQFQGTVYDTPAVDYAGAEKEEIRLSYLLSGDTWYWTGTVFSSGTAAQTAAWKDSPVYGAGSPRNWDYQGNVAWAGDREYVLEARGMDASRPFDNPTGQGNWEQPPYTTIRFIVDNTPPSVEITSPTELSLDAATNIYGPTDLPDWGRIRISTGRGLLYWTGRSGRPMLTISPGSILLSSFPTSWYFDQSRDTQRKHDLYVRGESAGLRG